MIIRSLLLATALIACGAATSTAQTRDDILASPVLRANVSITSDVVRIGDVIDNAGSAAKIAIYRAPDLGTTGSLPTASVIAALRAHQVIGVDTRELREISVTRLARTLEAGEIEQQLGRALEHRNGLGDAANLTLTFDRELQPLQLDAANTGPMQPVAARYDTRSGRFDVSFEIANETTGTPTRLRFTGIAVETMETAVLSRNVERNELLKSSDVVIERRPKAEVGNDPTSRERAVGMQARRQLRAGQPIKLADLSKPDLVTRDQNVTLIYESVGLYLTVRGKATEAGTEGDVVNVLNLQSKRMVSGTVVGRGQVSVSAPAPRPAPTSELSTTPNAMGAAEPIAAPVSVAINDRAPVSRKAE
jgi:flagella basal body P-ring formation protein FlgA